MSRGGKKNLYQFDKELVMKRIFFLLTIFVFLSAGSVTNEILLIEAKLYPKILYLIDDNEKKGKINVAIVVDNNTKKIGLKLKKLIKDKNLKIKITDKIDLNYDTYIFTFKNVNWEKINILLENKKILFTIYPNYVENAMFSIFIGPKIYPYVNPKLLSYSKIKFNPIILKVSKIYEK